MSFSPSVKVTTFPFFSLPSPKVYGSLAKSGKKKKKQKKKNVKENSQMGRKRSVWVATWQNQQCGCAPNDDSDQPGHPPSLIRVFAVRMKKDWVLYYSLSAQRRFWSDWADAEADLSLRWAHIHFVGFDISWLSLTLHPWVCIPRGKRELVVDLALVGHHTLLF